MSETMILIGGRSSSQGTSLCAGKLGTEYLFPFQSRKKDTKNAIKSRTDALQRRLARLCRDAGVPMVVPHSMRGLHSTIAIERGATPRCPPAGNWS